MNTVIPTANVHRRFAFSFAELCVLVSFFLLATSIFCMVRDIGSYVVWAGLSSASALVALLGIPFYNAAASLQPQTRMVVEARAQRFSWLSLGGGVIAMFLGEAWFPVAILLIACTVAVYVFSILIERKVGALLSRLDSES